MLQKTTPHTGTHMLQTTTPHTGTHRSSTNHSRNAHVVDNYKVQAEQDTAVTGPQRQPGASGTQHGPHSLTPDLCPRNNQRNSLRVHDTNSLTAGKIPQALSTVRQGGIKLSQRAEYTKPYSLKRNAYKYRLSLVGALGMYYM